MPDLKETGNLFGASYGQYPEAIVLRVRLTMFDATLTPWVWKLLPDVGALAF
jgi:hypothetical protein